MRDTSKPTIVDQDRHQIVDHVDDSLQLRGDEPVSELYIWGSKSSLLPSIDWDLNQIKANGLDLPFENLRSPLTLLDPSL